MRWSSAAGEGSVLVLPALSAGVIIILSGLGAVWFGLSLSVRASRALSPLATRLRGSAFVALGLSPGRRSRNIERLPSLDLEIVPLRADRL